MKSLCVLLCTSLLATIVCSQDPAFPYITEHPSGDVYKMGSEVTLNCMAENADSLQWSRNGAMIPPVAAGFTSGEGLLTIQSLSSSEKGSYVCLASNGQGTVVSAMAEVQIGVLDEDNAFHSRDASNPHQVMVTQGEPFTLDCGPVTSIPPTSIGWNIYENIDIDTAGDAAVEGLDGQLYLQDPSNRNMETYECRADNQITGSVVHGYVKVILQDSITTPPPPDVLSEPKDTTVNLGDTATFECIIGGTPLPIISWDYPAHLEGNNRLRLTQNNAVLFVRGVTTDDAGPYSCNAPGVGTFTAELTVRDSPSISIPLPAGTQTLNYGSTLSLSCSASGIDITWAWYHNGLKLAEFTSGTLTIDVTVEEDSGVYQCFAYNPAGFDSSAALVAVEPVEVSFVADGQLPATVVIFEGRSVRLQCEATGAPPPEYSWKKDGIPLGPQNDFTFPSAGVLEITMVTDTHMGMYTCVATNTIADREIGKVESSTDLQVIGATTITSALPPSYSIQLGIQVHLPCEVSSHEGTELQFSWTKDGLSLEVSGRLQYENQGTTGTIVLAVPDTDDAGVYVCVVMTTLDGTQAPTVQSEPSAITVSINPVAPTIISVDVVSSTAVKVRWFLPGDSTAVVSYTVQIQVAGSADGWTNQTQDAKAITESTVGGLAPYTRYDVQVVANYETTGATSEVEESVRTAEDEPGTAPEAVKAAVSSASSVFVQWELPALPNGVITNYTIQYRIKDSDSPWTEDVVPSSNTSHTLISLRSRTSYDIRVAAATSVGMGPYSEVVTVTVQDPAALQEPDSSPVHERAWFIVVMFILALGVVVIIVLVICGVVVRFSRQQKARTYQVRPTSGHYTPTADDISLSEDVVMDYESRTRREVFGSAKALEALEVESSIAGTSATMCTPGGSSLRLAPAPAYINPPPFEEALKSSRSRAHSTSSTVDKPEFTGSEWSEQESSKVALHKAMGTPDYPHHVHLDYPYEDESDSLEKPSYSSSELSDLAAEDQDHYIHPQGPEAQAQSVSFATFV